jgi:SAM-dependent methyltransferase
MTCLDLGCGGGDVTLQLATMVGPTGQAIGVDMDEVKLGLARQNAVALGLANVQFRQLNVQNWVEDSQYDFMYARFLLTHLTDPPGMLRRMLRAVRPGGVAVVEDIDFSGYFCYPPCAGFDSYVRLYRAAAAQRGADADIGPKLHSMFLDAGWRNPRLNVIQPTFTAGEGKELALLTLINIADSVVAGKLATEAELQSAVDNLKEFTDDPRTLIGFPRIFQLWARRERLRRLISYYFFLVSSAVQMELMHSLGYLYSMIRAGFRRQRVQ